MKFDPKLLEEYPSEPGVYLMKEKEGTVLYVGKAVNLKNRLKQYFFPGRDGRVMVPFLVSKVAKIDVIVVTSEKEALLLENTLIKQHQPPYNAQLKDDKSYTALMINTHHPWPKLSLVRVKGKPDKKNLYFGPYTSALAARETLEMMQHSFPLRECSDQELLRRDRPCILYQMHRCLAPCVGKCTPEEYDKEVQKTILFLRGQNEEVLKKLYSQMEEASEGLEFERAGRILNVIRSIEKTVEKQKVNYLRGTEMDAWGGLPRRR